MNKNFNSFEIMGEMPKSDDVYLISDSADSVVKNVTHYMAVTKSIFDYLSNKFRFVECKTPSDIGEVKYPLPEGLNENNCVIISAQVHAYYAWFANRGNPVVRINGTDIVVQNEDGVIDAYKNAPYRIVLMRTDI